MAAAAGQASSSLPQQILEYLQYPFTSCLPSSSNSYERQGLLDEASYDDSDAISLLSNIANRSRRRNRSTRRREEWNRRAAILGCGLFGRPKGQIQQRQVTRGDGLRARRQRNDSEDIVGNLGFELDEEVEPPRSVASSFGAGQESGDEDAGLLEDEDIAEISTSKNENVVKRQSIPTVHISEATDDAAMQKEQDKEDEERASLKARIEKEAEEFAKAQEEDAARLAEEEAALAAEEEAAMANAKRKAERRAAKEELLRLREESLRIRRRTEADAEAAAGGFDFAEEPDEYRHETITSPHYSHAQGVDAYGYEQHEGETQSPQLGQPEIVHHHHYYQGPPPEEEMEDDYDDTLLSPNFRVQELPAFPSQEQEIHEEAVEEDEDDADIAGIGFSKNRKGRSRGEGGSNTYSAGGRSNGSGSGSRQSGSADGRNMSRYEAHRRGSDNSTQRDSAGQSSSAGKRSYRDRPRRHERTMSKSTGSGAGASMREGVPSRLRGQSPLSAHFDDEQIADAAAGGFDDFVPPPSSYRSRDSRESNEGGSNSSQGRRREKRREGPASSGNGLNAPRNPRGGNVLTQDRDESDNF